MSRHGYPTLYSGYTLPAQRCTGSGIAIIFKVKTGLAAFLLGAMILIWFIILHIPKVIAAPAADRGGELTSAFLALAYGGIAFVVAGVAKRMA